MDRHGIPIDDLHALTVSFDGKFFTGPGNVHFTEEGSQRLAEQVAEQVAEKINHLLDSEKEKDKNPLID